MTELIGYFESTREVPAYDPGLDVVCIVCNQTLTEPMKTHGFMADEGIRSYFVRTHAECAPGELIGRLIDEVIGR